jgi:hypothetical protein
MTLLFFQRTKYLFSFCCDRLEIGTGVASVLRLLALLFVTSLLCVVSQIAPNFFSISVSPACLLSA